MELHIGITGVDEVEVTQAKYCRDRRERTLPLFATPAMLASMEKAAYTSVQPFLDEGCGTVGILLNAEHLAASPIGMHVRTESEWIMPNLNSIVKSFTEDRFLSVYMTGSYT